MTKDNQSQQAEEILGACLDRPESEWDAAIERACGEHPDLALELRERILTLKEMIQASGTVRGTGAAMPDRIAGFQLRQRIGGGGMGVVYAAYETALGREVALKVIRSERLHDASSLERFKRESEAIARLDHPGILSVYAAGEEEGMPWFSMPLLNGATLAEVLQRVAGRAPEALTGRDLFEALIGAGTVPERLPEIFTLGWVEACLEIGAQVARALEHAHARSIIHRDVKPSNIILTPHGHAILIDFGLTATSEPERDPLTRTGIALGTLVYMAPEQVLGRAEATPVADVYSLGATLHELLTLQPPYAGDTSAALEAAILRGEPESIRIRNRRVSDEAQTVILHAMAHRAGERYPAARALGMDLEAVLARRPLSVKRFGPLRRTRRWIQRNPYQSAVGALTLLAGAGIPLGMWAVERRNTSQVERALDAERSAVRRAEVARTELERALAGERAALQRAEDALKKEGTARAEAQDHLEAARQRGAESMAVIGFFEGMLARAAPQTGGARLDFLTVVNESMGELAEALPDHPGARMRLQVTWGNTLRLAGRYTEALPLLEEAVEHYADAEAINDRRMQAFALHLASKCAAVTGGRAKALEQARSAYRVAGDILEPTSERLAEYGLAYAETCAGSGGGAGEQAAVQGVLEHLEQHRPEDALRIAKVRAAWGQLLFASGEKVGAEMEMAKALESLRVHAGENDHERIVATLRMGNLPLLRGDFDGAAELFLEGHGLALATYGPDHDLTVAAESSLADLAMRQQDLPAARERFEALLGRAARLGPSHPAMATSSVNYMLLLHRMQDHQALCDYGEQDGVIAGVLSFYGEKGHWYGQVLRNLASAQLLTGRFERALETLGAFAAFAQDVPALKSDFLLTLMSMGSVARDELDDPGDAAVHFARALASVGDEPVRLTLRPGEAPSDVGLAALECLQELSEKRGAADEAERFAASYAARAAQIEGK